MCEIDTNRGPYSYSEMIWSSFPDRKTPLLALDSYMETEMYIIGVPITGSSPILAAEI